MQNVNDFQAEQRVLAGDREGTVVKLGRKYVHVLFEGASKPEQLLPSDLTVAPEPVVAAPVGNHVVVGGRLPKRATAKQVTSAQRKAARKTQRKSRRKNRV